MEYKNLTGTIVIYKPTRTTYKKNHKIYKPTRSIVYEKPWNTNRKDQPCKKNHEIYKPYN